MRIAQLRAYMEKWQKRLGVEHWQADFLIIPVAELDDEQDARLESVYPNLTAAVKIGEHLNAEERQESILHEVLHMLFLDLDIAVESMLDNFGGAARTLAKEQYNMATEQAIARLTRAFLEMEQANGK